MRRLVAINTSRFLALLLLLLAAGLLALVEAKPAHAKTFTVNSTGDENDLDFPGGTFDGSSDGICDASPTILGTPCTLRAAIQEANKFSGADTIAFNIPGTNANCEASTKVCTISPNVQLPPITGPVTIDGYTQRPCSSNPAPCSRPNTSVQGAVNSHLLIALDGSNAGISASGLGIEASNTLIKGLIIINFDDGIDSTESAKALKVQGNLLGTDNGGGPNKGNTDGADLKGNNSLVGGTTPAERNLISFNSDDGISISSSSSKIEGNLISINEGDGISMGGGNNTVGGATPGAGNLILANGRDGVRIANNEQATGNRILSNGELSIDLSGGTEDPPPVVGITLNDPKDKDSGPNGLQNYPVLDDAEANPDGTTTITGTLNSRLGKKFTIQFFSSDEGDPDGFGEGETFLGQKKVTTNKKGNASFSFTTTLPEADDRISATATGGGETSEFSLWFYQ